MQGEKEILALNAFDGRRVPTMDPALRDAVQRRLRSFGSASVLSYHEPLRMERAEGVWMFDAEGRRYHQVDYVPCYRSEAGTGNAMAFVYWD